ncbi:hypothetical protein HOP50_07g48270 [Chloropicon primus]|uniref:WD40 repeat domain-containing protein n=2 Tax=Chloropicon primus TaxID=1764295 RepID=A0A5B8MP65_9CHLO|nr:hypothetical protein A3770_07p48070 [Chloropicon primus]UPR01505.1 hypothetical protein HOP50_07g48270 [Chloropicon primus]|eukprot:QDZ22289.1 hypothetical protein A3770_07p48070 [Chloropicon primus]
MFNSPGAGVGGSGEPRASSSLSSPNVMTRRVLGTPLRKRRRGSGEEEGRIPGEGTDGACASCEPAQELSQRFERRKKQRKWLCERERLHSSNSLHKILQREFSNRGNLGFVKRSSSERFKRMQVQQMFNTYDPRENERWKLNFLKKCSKVVEIVGAKGMIFALAHSGVCAAFCRETNKRLCYLNIQDDEVVRSLFYNKNNETLITVSVYATDNFSSLKCRSTPLEFIRRGEPQEGGMPLFEDESLQWPGFVEFDDVNGKVLTYNAQKHVYKVFDLKNYNLLYMINDGTVSEIKVSPGILLLIHDYENKDHVPLKILSVEDGKVLKEFMHPLMPNRMVDFVEQFDEKLLVKQEKENLRITDVCSGACIEVANTQFMNPNAFIFLYENHLFLTFRDRQVEVWNFKGELVTSFEDHLLWHPNCNTNNIYITQEQDLIVSYCKPKQEGEEKSLASINVSSILTGKCQAKLGQMQEEKGCEGSSHESLLLSPGGGRISGDAALGDVTALFYNEERNEIYTGNASGRVFVWSN